MQRNLLMLYIPTYVLTYLPMALDGNSVPATSVIKHDLPYKIKRNIDKYIGAARGTWATHK